jgi:hypothetical protein
MTICSRSPAFLELPDEPQRLTPHLIYGNMKLLPTSESPPDSWEFVNDGKILCDIAKEA